MADEQLQLRPMGLGEILDTTFRLYRNNFLKFFTIVLAVDIVLFVILQGYQYALRELFAQGKPGAGTLVMFVASLFGGMFLPIVLKLVEAGALTYAVSQTYLGRAVSVGESFRKVRQRVGALLWSSGLAGLIIGLGFMALFVPGLIFYLNYLLVSQIVILEGLSGGRALKRSRELMAVKTEKGFFSFKHNRSRAFLITFLVGFITIGVTVGVHLGIAAAFGPPTMGQGPAAAMGTAMSAKGITTAVIQQLVQSLVTPIGIIAMILLYYDIRVRFEGFDLELMAAALADRQDDDQ